MDTNGELPAATAEKFLASLKATDTVTIFAGHSQYWKAPDGTKVFFGIELNANTIGNGDAARRGASIVKTADEIDVRNDIVAVFSCSFGPAFDNLRSSNGSAFVWISQGPDPETGSDSGMRAALRFAESVTEPSAGSFTRDSDLRRDVRNAQAGLGEFHSKANENDTVRFRYLPRL